MAIKRCIPLAAMERLVKRAVGDIRVSEDAKAALRDYLEEKGEEIATNAFEYAKYAKRKTVKALDIKLASKK
jgi:DNA-binding protein